MGPVGSPRPAPRGAPASSPTGPCRHPATTRPPVHTTLLPVGLAARPPPLGQLSSPLLWSRLAGGGQQGGRRQVCRAHGWLSVTLPPPSPAPFLQGMGSRIPSQLRRGESIFLSLPVRGPPARWPISASPLRPGGPSPRPPIHGLQKPERPRRHVLWGQGPRGVLGLESGVSLAWPLPS